MLQTHATQYIKKFFLLLAIVGVAITSHAQNSWQTLPDTGLLTPDARFEDVYFTDSTTGYAVNLSGYIFKTKDAGRHWIDQLNRPLRSTIRSIEFLDDKVTGLAGCLDTSGTVYRTEDAGNTWTNIGSTVPDTVLANKRMVCGITHFNNTFYAVGSWAGRIARFYKSVDKGITWKCYYPDSSLITSAVDVCFTSPDTGFITGAHSDFHSPFYNDRSVVLKTTDGGLSWIRVFSDTTIGGRIWKIQAVTSGILVGSIEPYLSDTVAMIRSMDGGKSWTIIGTGFARLVGTSSYKQTQGVGFINAQHGWLGGYYNGLYETKNGGTTWDSVSFGTNFNRFFVIDSNHVFAGGKQIYFYGKGIPEPTRVWPVLAQPHHLYPVTPNPATGKVKIEFDLLNSTNVLLQVASIDARCSWQLDSKWISAGHYVYYWDGSKAPAGNYIIWLGTNEIPIVQKFTKQP